jgi:hypothetical protein
MKVGALAAAAFLALATAATAEAKPRWPAGGETEARRTARQVVTIAIRGAAQPRGNIGTCRIEAIVVGTERGAGPDPGSPLAATVPCVDEATGANLRTRGGRSLPMAALEGGALARLFIGRGGKATDLELLGAKAGSLERSVFEVDKRQVWRLIHAAGDSLLVDTDDVEVDGLRRTAWVKLNPKKRVRDIVQILTRVAYDCRGRTQTLQAWYARTAIERIDSQGRIPEKLRVTVPVPAGSASARALASVCAAPLRPRS